MSFAKFGNRAGVTAHKEEVGLHYAFDFDDSETVVYTNAGPFPGRVFVLRFWRYGKDGIMHLLGYKKQGRWRDPTLCFPDSYVRYYRPQQPLPPRPHKPPGDATGHEQPQDTTQHRHQPAPDLEQLAYRVPLLKLDHGVWELPTLKGQPVHIISNARRYPKLSRSSASRQQRTFPPPLKKPVERTLEFVRMSTHFEHPSQADQELAKVVQVLKQFPQLQVTIQGNYQMAPGWLIRGYGTYVREQQDHRFDSPYTTKWPNGAENYYSIGQVMDGRAHAIERYLISHGISARRVHTARGQYTEKKTFTIIFSN